MANIKLLYTATTLPLFLTLIPYRYEGFWARGSLNPSYGWDFHDHIRVELADRMLYPAEVQVWRV